MKKILYRPKGTIQYYIGYIYNSSGKYIEIYPYNGGGTPKVFAYRI